MSGVAMLITLVQKDLTIAGRMRQTFGVVGIIGLLIVAIMALGLGPGAATSGVKNAAVLLLSVIVGGVLCFERTARVEYAERAIDALRLAPISPLVMYAAKLVGNLLITLVLGSVVTIACVILFNLNIASAPATFAGIMVLTLVGLAAVGTLMSIGLGGLGGGGRSDLLAMVVLPLLLPLVLVAGRLLDRVLGGESVGVAGIGMLVAVDLVYVVASWLVYECALEE